jgi:hypothetical protein
VDHEVLEAGILCLDRADAVDHLAGGPQNQAFCCTPSRKDGISGRRARRTPGAALLVGVAHEPERREPLVALVVRRLDLRIASSWLPAM